jgi:uncharacterized protein with PIN domain
MAEQPQITEALKLLCDSMLARLGRCLRAAGYDTDIAEPSEHDRELLARAIQEDRLLLTCDRGITEHREASGRVVVLPSNGLDRTARHLTNRLQINWLLRPFSRCLVDNSPLRPAKPKELCRLPQRARAIGSEEVFICPLCDRIYWPGSHVRRMYKQLNTWQNIPAADSAVVIES